MGTTRTRYTKSVRELHDKLVDAVDFVPPDNGDDSERTVEVELEDLRELVMVAWDCEQLARKADREARSYRANFREANERIKSYRDRIKYLEGQVEALEFPEGAIEDQPPTLIPKIVKTTWGELFKALGVAFNRETSKRAGTDPVELHRIGDTETFVIRERLDSGSTHPPGEWCPIEKPTWGDIQGITVYRASTEKVE